ncbi:MAG: hypothetical protein OXT65_10095 [Alphaproteobacteria bacterium]|nr:hypothetical protein [Alphaproteobacteria bacterium]
MEIDNSLGEGLIARNPMFTDEEKKQVDRQAQLTYGVTAIIPEYDPKVIVEFSSRLYTRAKSYVAFYTLVLGFIGGVASMFFWGNDLFSFFVGALFCGAVGYAIGSEKAFRLKLEAQMALCQLQIAENTKR